MAQKATDQVSAIVTSEDSRGPQYDAVVIGAGITGIYQAYRLRELGLSVVVLEAGDGVGGVWHWNRYPNARFDSESYTYGYLFDDELFQEWDWTEHFASQPEIERYLNHVVDKYDMRDLFQFQASVVSAVFDNESSIWRVETESGDSVTGRYVVAALGCLSAPIYPAAPGLENFRGEAPHTSRWPKEGVDFAGKRVAVIGTGSSGVQAIPTIASEAASLTVFQRTPNWCTPLNNSPITPNEQAELKQLGARALHGQLQDSFGGFLRSPAMVSALEVDETTRNEFFEKMYNSPGLAKMVANYWDVAVDPAANKLFSDFVAEKIRGRVSDPDLAAKLIPTDHGFAAKRPPMENGYFEVFNRDNVRLVDIRETPITSFTAEGLRTDAENFEFDIIVLATGFDFATGAYTRIDFTGVDGTTLAEHWADGPRTHMGLLADGFPNLFLVGGPHSTFGNMPRSTEILADVTARIIDQGKRTSRIETDKASEDEWTQAVYDNSASMMLAQTDNFFVGANVPGKARRFVAYPGTTLAAFREDLAKSAGENFERLRFS